MEISKIPNNFTDIRHLRAAHASYGAKRFYGVNFFGKPSRSVIRSLFYPPLQIPYFYMKVATRITHLAI